MSKLIRVNLTQQSLKNFITRRIVEQIPEVRGQSRWPRITIVTPSFNQSQYLERTILSVLNQNYPNLEYIIYDGGSSDNSIEIIRKYASELTYWESNEDEGQTHAITKGFNRATGDIMAWLNSDDVYTPNTFFTVAEQFLNRADMDVLYGDIHIIDEDDNYIRQMRSVPFNKGGFLVNGFSLYQPSMFWRREIYDKTSGLNLGLELAMDRELWYQFIMQNARFKHIRKTLSCYRDHDRTKTSKYWCESNRICSRMRYEMFGINESSLRFKIMKFLMRARTAFMHILLGNINYLLRDAGKPDHITPRADS